MVNKGIVGKNCKFSCKTSIVLNKTKMLKYIALEILVLNIFLFW